MTFFIISNSTISLNNFFALIVLINSYVHDILLNTSISLEINSLYSTKYCYSSSSSLLVILVTMSFIKNINNVNTIFKNGDDVSLIVTKQCSFISNIIPFCINKSNICII